jgi:flavin reductase (DIM6/NTAB) family NADH-FMN oxidoreductase RutF
MTVDPQQLRTVMGYFATGVTVITTRDKDQKPYGLTANAFTSLSLQPPLALVCIDRTVQCYFCFEESKVFSVNVLAEGQEEISRRFATKGVEKFNGVPCHLGENGVLLLDEAIAHLECRIVNSFEGGDHTIYIGEIIHADVAGERPLLFFRGKYCRLPTS